MTARVDTDILVPNEFTVFAQSIADMLPDELIIRLEYISGEVEDNTINVGMKIQVPFTLAVKLDLASLELAPDNLKGFIATQLSEALLESADRFAFKIRNAVNAS